MEIHGWQTINIVTDIITPVYINNILYKLLVFQEEILASPLLFYILGKLNYKYMSNIKNNNRQSVKEQNKLTILKTNRTKNKINYEVCLDFR